MKKRMQIMLVTVAILFGAIFGFKLFMGYMVERYIKSMSPKFTVSTIKAAYSAWQPKLEASGSVRAIQGVNVTTQLAGMVQAIYFTPGAFVKKNDVLVQLNADTEIGQLHSLQASAQLAAITYHRDKAQYAVGAVSKEQLDTDEGNLKSYNAQVDEQAATVAKLTITAPFSGRLGINYINLGQYLNPGDTVTSLQTLDPIYVDFYVPQQSLPNLKLGQSVIATTDSGAELTGKITTINPAVDTSTRNIEVEATFSNPKALIVPGMYVTVTVMLSGTKNYITLPQTAITFNSYGDIVYLIQQSGSDKQGSPNLVAEQVFVVTGPTRGDQIAVLKGVNAGDEVVSSGQLKLKNGSPVTINNSIQPSDSQSPSVPNEH